MATSVLGLKTFAASDPVDYNEVNDNYVKIDNGVKTAMQGRAAQNIMDNSNFADLIAQAGLNGSHGGTAYIADRWIGSADITPTAKTDGILLATTNHYAFIQQRVKVTRGKTYTLALSTTGGTTMQRIAVFNIGLTEIFASVEGSNGVIIATFDAAYDDMAMLLYPGYADGGGSAVFKWAALYEGAYTADTLPAYVPKGYAAELAECQRYYVYINSGAWMTGFFKLGEGLCVEIPTAGNIRINNPTVVLDDPKAYTGTGWNNLTIRSVAVNRHATKIVFDFVDSSAAQASYGDALIVFGIDAISADL